MDGWNTILSFWGWPVFRCELLVSGRVFAGAFAVSFTECDIAMEDHLGYGHVYHVSFSSLKSTPEKTKMTSWKIRQE